MARAISAAPLVLFGPLLTLLMTLLLPSPLLLLVLRTKPTGRRARLRPCRQKRARGGHEAAVDKQVVEQPEDGHVAEKLPRQQGLALTLRGARVQR